MKLLVTINLLLLLLLLILYRAPSDSGLGEGRRANPHENAAKTRVNLQIVENPSGARVMDKSDNPIDENGEWSLPRSALRGVSLDALSGGDPPRCSDEIIKMIDATQAERSQLDQAVASAFTQLKSVERANMELRTKDGESWIHLREHNSEAGRNLAVLESAVVGIVGKDRARVVNAGVSRSDYFRSDGYETSLGFKIVEPNSELMFTAVKYKDGARYSIGALGGRAIKTEDELKEVQDRYGHLMDVDPFREYITENPATQ